MTTGTRAEITTASGYVTVLEIGLHAIDLDSADRIARATVNYIADLFGGKDRYSAVITTDWHPAVADRHYPIPPMTIEG
jgi:hypothetical protein